MLPNDCYLTEEQKTLLRSLVPYIKQEQVEISWEGNAYDHIPQNLWDESWENARTSDYKTFVKCGYFEEQIETYFDVFSPDPDSYTPYEQTISYYTLDISAIIEAVESDFTKTPEKKLVSTIQNQLQRGKPHMPKFKGLDLAQWEFLVALAIAFPDYLTKHNEQVYYIKPELNEDNTEIIGFDGFASEFYPSHKEQLNISMSDFVKLVPDYLRKARQGNYYLNAETIAADVKAYQEFLDSDSEPTNQIFSTPSKEAQFQCDIFMVMPFREHLDPVYADHVRPIVDDLGFKILRGDDPFSENDIMFEVWSMINNARLIIADCTERNPNVFYELGIAHTLGKPAIMITQNIDDIPFDVRGKRAIVYEYTPHGMKEFEAKLKSAIEGILG